MLGKYSQIKDIDYAIGRLWSNISRGCCGGALPLGCEDCHIHKIDPSVTVKISDNYGELNIVEPGGIGVNRFDWV